MAGVLVDVLLERLTTLAFDKVEREFNLVAGVKNEVKNLTRSLKAIQAVLEDAEQRQVTEVSVRRWLKELEDVSYEMDDVLDEWITQVQIHQMGKQENQGEHALLVTTTTTSKKKVCFPFLSSCCSSSQVVKQYMFRREIAERIEELNERLAQIDNDKQKFSFQSTTKGPELPERQQTTSLLPEKTFGRVEEKGLILGKLLGEGSGDETSVPVIIPIIGMGGMGKTTLAQLVYNDDTVKSHFDERIWVCVSDPFEEVKIAKAIIEGLGGHTTSDELQTLSECILKLTEGKKFLLVLDDVWNPNLSQWEELVKPLRNGVVGSRVLVTTRKEEVVIMMKANTREIHLNKLGEELCLSLFFYYADIKESGHEVFQAIGKEIVRKCNGLPLAIKTLGSHMRDKKTIQEWRDVLSSKIWENEEIKEPVFKPLSLSYNDLRPIIKRCLLYCIIFPKDYVYDRDNLIELWMSQDYLDVTGSVGKKYFDTLVRRSFFQDIKVYAYGKTVCKMHDILHDFLQSLAKSEWFINDFEPTTREEMVMTCDDKIRHLAILQASQSDHLVSFPRCEHLRTLVAFGSPINSNFLASILQLKCARTLNLSDSDIEEIPKEIGGLIHLRYLDLSKNHLKEIIHLSSLYNLQTLRLVECYNLGRVDLRGLTNLRHLMTSFSNNVKLIGVDQLTNLRELDQLNVHSDDVQLGVLENLNQHQPILTLRNLGQSNSNEAGKANLVSKEHLRALSLDYGNDEESSSTGSNRQQNDREILNAIHPPPGLESLKMYHYAGNTLRTDWFLSLNSLTSLMLVFCRNCKHLPPLGKLPSLESLQMRRVGVEKVGVEFLGIETPTSTGFVSFPKLKRLRIHDSEQLKEWKGVEELSEAEKKKKKDITIMPCLSSLLLSGSEMLPALPDFLWKTPLRELDIGDCPRLRELYRGGEGSENEWAKISHIPNIKFNGVWIQGQGEPNACVIC